MASSDSDNGKLILTDVESDGQASGIDTNMSPSQWEHELSNPRYSEDLEISAAGHTSGLDTDMKNQDKINAKWLIDEKITAANLRRYEDSNSSSEIYSVKLKRSSALRLDLQGLDTEELGVANGFARYAIQSGPKTYANVHIERRSGFSDDIVREAFHRSLNQEDVWLTEEGTTIEHNDFTRVKEFGSGAALWVRKKATKSKSKSKMTK